jgi:hypothetical protein
MAGYCVTLEARSLVLQVRRPSSVARLSESALIGTSAWLHRSTELPLGSDCEGNGCEGNDSEGNDSVNHGGLAFRAVSAWRHQRDDAGVTMPTFVQGGRERSRCKRDLDEMTSRQSNGDCVDSDGMQQFR